MDGGSGINIMYAGTMRKMGLSLTGLRPSPTHFHGIMLGKKVEPLGQINLEVVFGSEDNFRAETLCFEVVPFKGATTPCSDDQPLSNSWRYRATHI